MNRFSIFVALRGLYKNRLTADRTDQYQAWLRITSALLRQASPQRLWKGPASDNIRLWPDLPPGFVTSDNRSPRSRGKLLLKLDFAADCLETEIKYSSKQETSLSSADRREAQPLKEVLGGLPIDFPGAILIVIHMAEDFAGSHNGCISEKDVLWKPPSRKMESLSKLVASRLRGLINTSRWKHEGCG